jgi:hypothetical protein
VTELPKRAIPTPVIVHGIHIADWPSTAPADEEGWCVETLHTADAVYCQQIPFANFGETPIDRCRRLCRALIAGRSPSYKPLAVSLDVERVMHRYLSAYGHPREVSERSEQERRAGQFD